MTGWKLLLAMLVSGLILFIWSGISQNIPWGVKSVKPDVKNEAAILAISSELENGMLYLNGEIVALVVAKPKAYYSSKRFLGLEFVTQFMVGVMLCFLLAQLPDMSLVNRQFIVLLASHLK